MTLAITVKKKENKNCKTNEEEDGEIANKLVRVWKKERGKKRDREKERERTRESGSKSYKMNNNIFALLIVC